MDLFKRIQGVFFNPKLTFKAISEKPAWVSALIILLIFTAVFTFVITPYAQKDQLESLKKNIERQERMGRERYEQQLKFLEDPPKALLYLSSIVLAPVSILIGFLISSLIVLAIGRMFSTEGNFKQILAVFIHANFVDKVLGNAVRLVLILSRKSAFQTTTSIAFLFPRLETTSLAFKILSQFDFFQLWLFGIFGYGLSSIFKIEVKKAMFISYLFWLLKSLLYVAIALISPQAM